MILKGKCDFTVSRAEMVELKQNRITDVSSENPLLGR